MKKNIAKVKVLLEALPYIEKFSGKTVVFTGSLSSMARNEAEQLVRRQGGRASSGVSKETDLVVAGSESGSKYDKAKKLAIKIIDEAAFKKMLKGQS